MKLKRWELSCQDCRRALDMDQTLVKGHFFLGQSLLELEYYDEAIKHLQRGKNKQNQTQQTIKTKTKQNN